MNEANNLLVNEPENKTAYKKQFNAYYSSFAKTYDSLIKKFPLWKHWIKKAIPFIQGPRILEISFGTGYLLTQYAKHFETFALDYNETMAGIAKRALAEKGLQVPIQIGDVEKLPYRDESFNTIVNTFAFSSYPDGAQAISEMLRVLTRDGRIVLIDFSHPKNGNFIGTHIIQYLEAFERDFGLTIRKLNLLFEKFNLTYNDQEIGAFGSIHLYIAEKG